jgi:glycosyltransferase involved in cell wall biosynthesis
MIMTADLPRVSIVVIGRNEEQNLSSCFQSIRNMDYPSDRLEVIYVDTGSKDRSTDIALGFGVKVIEEHSDFPTPGIARNRGIEEASHSIIHFVDGDMIIDRAYLKKAVEILKNDDIACVIGKVAERNSDRSLLSHMLSYPWRIRKPGYIDAPGAGGTFQRSVLKEIGGYNADILKGQETELGRRIRQQGYRIYMMENRMGVHDYSFHNILDFVNHMFIIGKSYGRILLLPSMISYSDLTARARSLLIQGVALVLLTLVLVLIGLPILIVLFPPLVTLYVLVKYRKVYYTQKDWSAFLYYLLMHFGKPVAFAGMVTFFIRHFLLKKVGPNI